MVSLERGWRCEARLPRCKARAQLMNDFRAKCQPTVSRLLAAPLSGITEPMTTYAADLAAVRAAAERIAQWAHRTPVHTCATLDQLAGRALFFKCENFQKVGAFKFRGACNAVMKLPDDVARRGVVTHSSGNHAQALALAAKLRGIPAHIVMPS